MVLFAWQPSIDTLSFMSKAHNLLALIADGEFHSGEELGRELGVSRAAVWKYLGGDSFFGLKVDAVQGRGYRLRTRIELLDLAAIETAIDPAARTSLGEIIVLGEVDSTNTFLLRQADALATGTVCLAEMQTAGRGRRGRKWVSPFGSNLYLSMLRQFSEGPAKLAGLSLGIAVACVRALRRAGIEGITLKWPNDLLWEGRKLAGILLEVAGEANGPCNVVVGIGVNLGMRGNVEIDRPWADIQEIEPRLSRNLLAGLLINELARVMHEFECHGFGPLRREWQRYDAYAGQPVGVHLPNTVVRGVARGVDETGLLLLETETGVQRFASGEVSLREA